MIQAEPATTPQPPTENRLLKYILLGLGGLLFLAGTTYAGYWYGKMSNVKTQISKPQLKTENLTPTEIPIVILTPTSIPTPDPTADWKTYRNEKYKFLFKYPSNLTVRSGTRPDFVGFLEGVVGTWPQKFGFWILDNSENLGLREYLEKYHVPAPDDRLNIIYKSTFINGHETLIINYDSPCYGVDRCGDIKLTKSFSVNIKGNRFIVSFGVDPTGPTGTTSENEEWLNQILSTFKFLD